jgi:N-methylhydantoinase A/oxoprolinase/acetone carboxylase beta subunit
MPLDPEAAARGIMTEVGQVLGVDVTQAAWGIHEVVNAKMAQALRMVSVARGEDPRRLTMVTTGGAGPAHACRLARELGVTRVVLPARAGVASAIGLLAADMRFDLSRTFVCRIEGDEVVRAVRKLFDDLRERALTLAGAQLGEMAPQVLYEASMRYVGQGFAIAVPVMPEELQLQGSTALVRGFHKVYHATYGDVVDEPVEGVHWKVTLVWPSPALALSRPVPGGQAGGGRKAHRDVFFPEANGYVACPVYDRAALVAGASIGGPAVVEDPESTAVILPGDDARVDGYGNVIVSVRPGV